MSATLAALRHESEQHRQHPRFRIPVNVEIDGWLYPVREWSLMGFSIAGLHGAGPHEDGPRPDIRPIRFVFRFEGFAASFDLNAETIWERSQDALHGFRFHDLDGQQLAGLRAVIDAYVAGELVFMGDLLHVLRRDGVSHGPGLAAAPAASARALAWQRGKRVARLAALGAALVLLLGFAGWQVYRKLFVVQGQVASLDAAISVVRAPQPSFFEPVDLGGRDHFQIGEPVALMQLVGGGATTIDSPCRCRVVRHHVRAGEFVATGEPLMTLLPLDEALVVVAEVGVPEIGKVTIGDAASARLPDGNRVVGRVVDVRTSLSPERRAANPLGPRPASPSGYGEVVVALDSRVPVSWLGALVALEIDTFRSTR